MENNCCYTTLRTTSLCISVLFFVSIIIALLIRCDFYDLRRFSSPSHHYLTVSSSSLVVQPQHKLRMKAISAHDLVGPITFGSKLPDQIHRNSHNNRTSSKNMKTKQKMNKRRSKLELGLARARASIRNTGGVSSSSSSVFGDGKNVSYSRPVNRYFPVGAVSLSVYRNPRAFFRSYLEMEKRFKVYVYPEGEMPIVHHGPCKDLYTIEGRFIYEMEHGAHRFRTRNAKNAHAYFMPFSVAWMVRYLDRPSQYDLTPLRKFVSDYVRVISTKHPFWNRTLGADHFMLACHDWGPLASQGSPDLYNHSIRVLCNANSSEGFNPQKDVSLPEIHLLSGNIDPQLISPPPTNASRRLLAFFAGGLHGPIRPLLLHHWKDHDPNMSVHEYLPRGSNYYSYMLNSKFCLCPSGYEVASPRIVEAIYAECVPVILSKNYVLPFSDVLNWDAFSVGVEVTEIPRLKEILEAVPEEKYRRLKEGVRAVRRHFVLNQPSKRFDAFHMILHSIWLRRLNVNLG